MAKISFTVLCENSVAGTKGTVGEHGWAVLIESEDLKILFDTGQGLGIINNALALKKDLGDLDAIVLSHGHYDHTSGLPDVLNLNKTGAPIPVYAHPDIFLDRYWMKEGENSREIGIRYKRAYLESIGAEFRFVKDFKEIFPNIYVTGEVPRVTAFEPPDPNMKIYDKDGNIVQDELLDDLSLVVKTAKGLVVVLGCAHAGMINILKHVRNNLPDIPIDTVFGGTHLGFAGMKQLNETIKALEEFEVKHLGAAHCTGILGAAKIKEMLKDRAFFAPVGTYLEFEL